MCVCSQSVWLFATPWTVARQAPLSMGFSGQEYWSGLPVPPAGDLPDPGIEPASPALAGKFFITEPWLQGLLCPVLKAKGHSPLVKAYSATHTMDSTGSPPLTSHERKKRQMAISLHISQFTEVYIPVFWPERQNLSLSIKCPWHHHISIFDFPQQSTWFCLFFRHLLFLRHLFYIMNSDCIHSHYGERTVAGLLHPSCTRRSQK